MIKGKKIKKVILLFFMMLIVMTGCSSDNEKVTDYSATDVKGKVQNNVSERDIALVLDRSGSMEGYPLEQTKLAACNFFDTVFEKNSRIGLISYSGSAYIEAEIMNDKTELKHIVDTLYADGNTNIYTALESAEDLLSKSGTQKKIIVLMTDGVPTDGPMGENYEYETPLVEYAETLKDKGYYIYTLGFFSNLYEGERFYAQNLLEEIASPGLHYEVDSAENLVYFFDDIANQISGKQYVYVKIACPVDVTVKSGKEVLSSKKEEENTRTSFGTLTYEEVAAEEDAELFASANEEETDKVKVLRLDMSREYDIEIEGYDSGMMDYTIIYPDDNGEYTDVRKFPNVSVTATTNVLTNTAFSDASYLEVDEDGDGKYETKYKTESNGMMERVSNHKYWVLLICLLIVAMIVAIIITICRFDGPSRKTAEGMIVGLFGGLEGYEFPIYTGYEYIIGRGSECDICVQHKNIKVSRRHCCVQLLPNGLYRVIDYSSNGTYNGSDNQKLPRNIQCDLPKGTLLVLGNPDNVIELR